MLTGKSCLASLIIEMRGLQDGEDVPQRRERIAHSSSLIAALPIFVPGSINSVAVSIWQLWVNIAIDISVYIDLLSW